MDITDVTVNDLTGEQKSLAEVIGMEAYIKLVETYGGCNIYIAKADKLLNLKRDKEIYKKFNGNNYTQLAKEYNLTVRTVYEIVGEGISKYSSTQLNIWDL